MDEQQFRKQLNLILNEEIPTVNLWERISEKMPASKMQAVRPGLRLSRVPTLMAVMVLTAAVAYAVFVRLVLPSDPGVTAVQEADLLTAFDQTVPVVGAPEGYDLTVTLDYAYADVNRVLVGYTVRGVSPTGMPVTSYSNPTVLTPDGVALDRLMLSAHVQSPEDFETSGITFFSRHTTNFVYDGLLDVAKDTFWPLKLVVEVALTEAGTGEFPQPMMMLAGVAEFEFEVRHRGGEAVAIGQTVQAEGVDVELERAVISPSMVRLDMCYDLPDLQAPPAWSPLVAIEVGDETVFRGQVETYGLDVAYDLNEVCRGVIIPDGLNEYAGQTWSLTIEAFADYSGAQTPSIEGPWEYTFDVPVLE